MSSCGLNVERRHTPFGSTLVLSGELDLAVVGVAETTVFAEIDAETGDVSLDLGSLDFVGFAGLDLLVRLSRQMEVNGRRLRVAAISPAVDRILEIAGIRLAPAVTGDTFVPTRRAGGVPDRRSVRHRDATAVRSLQPGSHHRSALMPDDLSISITETAAGGVALAVSGELDLSTASQLRSAVDDAVARGGTVQIDLREVSFIDSTGLHALIQADQMLQRQGQRLYVTDQSPALRRLLELAGLTDYFAPQPAWSTTDPAIEEPIEQRLQRIITELASALFTATSLRDDLEHLIAFSCQTLPHCDAGSIALLIDGAPTTVAVSEHVALELDIAQYDSDNGPCLAALDGARIRVDVVNADQRFPHFARGASERGVNSVLSMPINHRDDIIGTLNFYSYEPDAFDDNSDRIARLASAQAAQAIARSDVLTNAHQRRDQLQAHYDQTALVARAQGVVIATQQCSAEQARLLLQNAATTTGNTLITVAQRILETARNQPNR